MASFQTEIASLDRVLTRLALTEEAQLEKVLSKLLPVVIDQLKSPHDQTRKKVLELLSHVNKRVKGHNEILLPLEALLALYYAPASGPLVRNFALVYVEMAFERASAEERGALVSELLRGISGRSAQHQEMLLRMASTGLAHLSSPPPAHRLGTEQEFSARYPFLSFPGDRQAFLDFALKVLLYQPPVAARVVPSQPAGRPQRAAGPSLDWLLNESPDVAEALTGMPLAEPMDDSPEVIAAGPGQARLGRGALHQNGGRAQGPARIPPPPGLSEADVKLLLGKAQGLQDERTLTNMKLGILNFTAAAGIAPGEVVIHYLVASVDPQDAVARRGEELSRKRCATDGMRPPVDLEDKKLLQRMLLLFHGSKPSAQIVSSERQIMSASPAVRARLVGLFSRSIAAASIFPDNLRTVFACVYDPTAQRLRQPGMEFAVWIFKHAEAEPLQAAAPPLLRGLLHLLDDEELAGTDAPSSALRGFTYQAIGQLATRAPALFRSDAAVASRFFSALSTEKAGVRAALQEALSALATAHCGCSGEAAQQVEALLLDAVKAEEEAARLCAAQWAQRLFPFDHVPARYVCVLAAGDTKLEVREAGLAGLQDSKAQPGEALQQNSVVTYPEPSAVVEYFRDRIPRLRSAAESSKPLAMPHRAFLAVIDFLRRCRKSIRSKSDVSSVALPEVYLGLLEHALVRDSPSELHAAALEAVLEVAAANPPAFAGHYRHQVTWLQGFLGHVDAAVRDLAARLLGIVAMALSRDAVLTLLSSLLVPLEKTEGKAAKFEEVEGAVSASGYVLAQCLTGVPMVPENELQKVAVAIFAIMVAPKADHAATAALSMGHAGLRVPLLAMAPPAANAEPGKVAETAGSSVPPAGHNGALSSGPKKSDVAESFSKQGVLQALASMMAEKDIKVATRAATAAGFLCNGDSSGDVLSGVLEAIIKTSTIKSEALHFAVGEALCFAFGGLSVNADAILYTNYQSLAEIEKAEEAEKAASSSAAEPMQVDGQQEARSVSPERGQIQEQILERILGQLIYDPTEGVRAAACVWLVSLCRFTGRQPRLLARLADIQEAFSSLLGDSSEIAQEMASQGLSVIYQLGDAEEREKLLSSLMGTLQGGPRKRRAVKLTGESKVFEEGQLGEAPGGGSLATYRELCALATEMGQPDLLVRFMDLANHASAMASTRGAAYGFASIAKLAGEQLQPYIAILVPKLYRYQYDPNPRVRDAMTHIWRALVDDPKQALDSHFAAVVRELLKDMGGRLWRNREAACSALADLLQGRRWPEVKDLLEEMWVMVLRASDDIKDSVRTAAGGALRTLRSVTLRLADPAATSPANAAAAVALMLSFLLQTGVGSSVKEVQALSLITIAKMVEKGDPEHIRPQLARLVPTMLESLSGMEDTRLNYVEQHAERIGLDSGRLENLRVAASKSSPMSDTLDLCARYSDVASLEALVPALCQLLKRGVGVNTRVGSARFVASLATRMGSDIRPHTGTLLKAVLGAARNERSTAVRRSYAQAAATVVKYAMETRAAKFVAEATALYTEPGDREARQLAGLLLRELVRGASDTFSAHAAAALPLAFVACQDEDADVAAIWKEVWEEGTGSAAAAVRLYMPEIVPLICDGLASQQWGRKSGSAKSIASLVELGGSGTLTAHAAKLGDQLMQELPGRLWEGKETVLEALEALVAAEPAAFQAPDAVIAALLGAVDRKKAAFQTAALAALQKVLAALPSDHLSQVASPLLAIVEQHKTAANTPKPEGHDGDEEASTAKPAPLAETVQCLVAAWQHSTPPSMLAHGTSVADAILLALSPERPWAQRAMVLPRVSDYVAQLSSVSKQQQVGEASSVKAEVHNLLVFLLPGVLECTKEARISQLRIAALDALSSIVKAASDAGVDASLIQNPSANVLDEILNKEKNAIVLGKAQNLRSGLNTST